MNQTIHRAVAALAVVALVAGAVASRLAAEPKTPARTVAATSERSSRAKVGPKDWNQWAGTSARIISHTPNAIRIDRGQLR